MTACVIAALSVPVTAQAANPSPRGSIEHVLLTLKPQDRGALRALARGAGGHGRSSAAALARALPSRAQQQSVSDTARSLGLHVDRVGKLSVLVDGPASLVRQLFGSARAVDPRSPMQHPLPGLPAGLRGAVTIALGGDDTRPALHHYAMPNGTADGTDFRTAYGDTVTAPLSPPTAADKNTAIATVQLSGWHSSDLSRYAAYLRDQTANPAWPAPTYTGIDDPLLPSCIAPARGCSNIEGDDVEVDLDQEAIYATAPYAHQRAYTSGNDFFGLYDSLAAIGDDASDPTADRHIAAATISWGFCETDLDSDPSANELYATFEDVLSYDLATGVTVFASSGDTGGECDGTHRGVGYPASSPQVVSVGGTQYAHSVATDQPSGWVDPGWTPGTVDPKLGASTGGVSRVFPEPAYQRDAGIAAAGRAVPDVSAMAGSPGFTIVTTSPSGRGRFRLGGTSASSPITAATYAVQVAQHGYSWGVGNILPGLYRQPAGFTDVTDNCAAGDSTCPGWNGVDVAHAGYDEVTGLGTPSWSTLVSPQLGGDPHLTVGLAYSRGTRVPVAVHTADWQDFNRFRIDVDSDHVCTLANATETKPTSVKIDDFGFKGLADGVHDLTLTAFNTADDVCHFSDAFVFVDTTRPSPTAQLSVRKGRNDVVAKWSGGDFGGSGIKSYHVTLAYRGRTVLSTTTRRAGSASVPARRGKTYVLSVRAIDRAGNASTTSATLLDDTRLALSRGWSRQRSASAFDGSSAASSRSGAQASARLTGRAYTLYVTTCPSCGKLSVLVDGKAVKTVDTYAATTHHRVGVTVFTARKVARRSVRVKVLGSRNRHSHGTEVLVDAISTKG